MLLPPTGVCSRLNNTLLVSLAGLFECHPLCPFCCNEILQLLGSSDLFVRLSYCFPLVLHHSHSFALNQMGFLDTLTQCSLILVTQH